MRITRYQNTRYLAVYASDGALVCITVYRKGAAEVVRRLQHALETVQQGQAPNGPTQSGAGPRGNLRVVLAVILGSGWMALPFLCISH